jgi:hypothetical protein
MFDYAFREPKRDGKPRYMTTLVSAFVHVAVLGFAIGLPILYASDKLPEVPDMMAFVVEAPPPPPPPAPCTAGGGQEAGTREAERTRDPGR